MQGIGHVGIVRIFSEPREDSEKEREKKTEGICRHGGVYVVIYGACRACSPA